MTVRENISLGSAALAGDGDNLRQAGNKMNRSIGRLFYHLGGDSDNLSRYISIDSDELVFEGTLLDDNETRVKVINPTADRTIQFPDLSGTIILDSGQQTLYDKKLSNASIYGFSLKDSSDSSSYVFNPGTLSGDVQVYLPSLSSNDTITFNAATQTLTNKTLTSPNISDPDITGSIKDANGANSLTITATGSAVNYLTLTNSATGSSPTLSATGSDSNVDLVLNSKNRGAVRVSKGSFSAATAIGSSGTASRTRTLVPINSGSPLNITIADGNVVGEYKILVNRGAGTATVTPTNFGNGTSFTLGQNESCMLIWVGSNWFVIGNQSVLTIT